MCVCVCVFVGACVMRLCDHLSKKVVKRALGLKGMSGSQRRKESLPASGFTVAKNIIW